MSNTKQSFSQMKKNRKNKFEDLQKKVDELSQGKSYQDDRIWSCERDKAGNGYAIIRFLPAPKGEDLAWTKLWNHGFQGPGGWYIENSRTSIGGDDPVSDANNELWNSGIEANKDIARARKRRLQYFANIYVVKDAAKPDNEGKVFLFKFGAKIFDHIKSAMHPDEAFEDEKPMNPFDFWEGANFKLKIRKVEGYANYDKSEFESPSPLLKDDAKLEEIWNQEYPLAEFLDEKNFKTYEELKKKFNRVVNGKARDMEATVEDDEETTEAPAQKGIDAVDEVEETVAETVEEEIEEDDDESFAKLKGLAV